MASAGSQASTRSDSIDDSAVMISWRSDWQKYPRSAAALWSANGSTAIVFWRISAGADRAPRRSTAGSRPLEGRRVAALRQLDHELVGPSLLAVVAQQARAQPSRLDADDRVGARIERRLLVEDLHADDVLLQLIAAPGDRLADDEVEEALEAIDLPERRAGEEAFELLALRRVLAGRRRRRRQLEPGSDLAPTPV